MRGVQAALARGIMASAVAMVAERMVETALSDATTDRQFSVRQRAQERVLEYTGTVVSGRGLTVNVDNRRIDEQTLDAWHSRGPDGLTGAERFRAHQARIITSEPDSSSEAT